MGDKYFPAKIIEMQANKTDPLKNSYYVHFGHVIVVDGSDDQVNRRMDTWMTAADILPPHMDPSEV